MITPAKAALSIQKSCCRPTAPPLSLTAQPCGTAWRGGGPPKFQRKRGRSRRGARAMTRTTGLGIHSQFVSRGMCVDYAIHDTNSGNPHCHIMLTMRPLDERGAWAAKSKKEYDLDENGERIRLPSGRYKTHKIDLTGWNDKDNTLLWRKAWADYTNNFLRGTEARSASTTAATPSAVLTRYPPSTWAWLLARWRKKGIATEKGELNRNIQKANRLIREIRAQIGKLKEWIADLFKARETAPEQPPQSPNLANLLMKYLSVQREKSRKYSQRWQQQHTADELKTIAAAVNYLSEHGISNLDELDASLSSVSDKAYSIREGMKTAEQRMKELQKAHGVRQKLSNLQAHTGRVSANPLERKTGEVCGSPPRRAYPMGRGKPLSPCKSAERNKDLAYCGMGNRNMLTSKRRGTAIIPN